jgi:precorrin-4 methylase
MVSAERQTEVLTHLLSREQRRQRSSNVSRIEAGDQDLLLKIREISRVRPVSGRVFAVQPGLSAQLASDGQLELISVTENYLKETYQIPFVIVGSP